MWVARDKDTVVRLFLDKPKRYKDTYWCGDSFSEINIGEFFPELKWEDEPIEVELISKQELNILKERAKQAPTTPYMGY